MRTTDKPRWSRPLLSMAMGAALLAGCSVHRHRIGSGPNGIGQETARQYYVFFGLLRLNEADSQRMTRDLNSYEIVTELSFVDLLLAPFLLPLTVTSRTVTVYR